tara:strand:+ start:211 stop:453 length:243 start_codon:yes stop_codon:yes gene_type:complete
MTGYNSKRQAAQDKMEDDDDTQVYADTLLIVYQRGFSDGKRSAQRPWQGLTDEEISALSKGHIVRSTYARAVEAKLKEKT